MSEPTGYCRRCATHVPATRKFPRLRHVARAYLILPIALLPVLPFVAGDYLVSLPVMMAYMLGIGPLLVIVKDPAVCAHCGALLDPPGKPAANQAP
jgi:hypothetical protein